MPTPSIQTLRTDAQQVLNLDSISAVRSVVAATLANANAGTPLNPNLTTQQLWNEFYQIVTQPKSDIESIITNQLMKFLYAPPAPGGVGADGQVIFNDGGVLAGDPQFLWNKTTNLLTVTGSATITGDLTVDTSTLKVTASNNRVGVNTATPESDLDVRGLIAVRGTPTFPSTGVGPELFWSPGNSNSNLYSYNRGTSGWAELVIGSSNLLFQINGVNSARLDSVNDFNLLSGNLKVSSGKGIDFSATAGTGTSELLNDYEEGTFTGTLKGSVSDPTVAVTATGRYTKVGRQVTVQIEFNNVSTAGASGNAFVIGLPFANSSAAGCVGSVITFSTLTFTETLSCIVGGVSTAIDIYSVKSNSSWVTATHNAGTGRYLWLNITYTV